MPFVKAASLVVLWVGGVAVLHKAGHALPLQLMNGNTLGALMGATAMLTIPLLMALPVGVWVHRLGEI